MHGAIQQNLSRLKPYLRWAILGGTLFFIAKTLKDNWQEVLEIAISINSRGLICLVISFGVTLSAHIWSGWVWSCIFRELEQPVQGGWGIQVYLITNIAKYLPGNVWHFYGRIREAQAVGIPFLITSQSVLMESLLMSAAALLIALFTTPQANLGFRVPILALIMIAVHPRVLNPLTQYLAILKGKVQRKSGADKGIAELKRYPLLPLLGELGFVGLRGAGFLITVLALRPFAFTEIPLLLSTFSLSWVLGLVIPGAPGGFGVFEATAITLLDGNFSDGIVLSAVALYRLISILAEVIGAGVAWLNKCLSPQISKTPSQDLEEQQDCLLCGNDSGKE
ncbi:MAG: UPF0104 family protein [Symploca sp. SIO1C4]|uniref:UPF0104 family protein n=1 Tax=Symploca sp. SIO1C4 TaxID=2607765 RepID=A0A6B3NAH2_9CYAN|nr:UPF0104 family protein [Symploca sp. SIO1C4]